MPDSHVAHIEYTRRELTQVPYYVDMVKVLNEASIQSFLDIGANIGEFCNCMFELVPSLTKAILIEPEKGNIEFLKNHIQHKDKIQLFEGAIAYGFTEASLFKPNSNVGGYQVLDEYASGLPVEVFTLEELDIETVDFVKIDVEGGEYNILPNSTYLQSVPWIDIEFHKFNVIPTKSYIAEHFPNHQIALIENTFSESEIKNMREKNPGLSAKVEDYNGRCLLQLKS